MPTLEEQAAIKAALPSPLVETVLLTPDEMAENLAISLHALIADPPVEWVDVPTDEQDTIRQFITDLTAYVQRIA